MIKEFCDVCEKELLSTKSIKIKKVEFRCPYDSSFLKRRKNKVFCSKECAIKYFDLDYEKI